MKTSESWSTNNLIMRNAITNDIKDLNLICDSWEDNIILEGEGFQSCMTYKI